MIEGKILINAFVQIFLKQINVIHILKDMTGKAIDMLSTHEQGFFLFVEDGLIDDAHHNTKAHKALDETIQFYKARLESTVSLRDHYADSLQTLINIVV